MDELVIMHDQQAVTTSLQVAETFGKNHRDVMESIRGLMSSAENSALLDSYFARSSYKATNGKTNPMYYMNRDGFTLLAMGFTGSKALQFKLSYIQAFNEAEEVAKQAQLPQTPEERLALTMVVADRTAKKVTKIEARVTDIEENAPIAPGEYSFIARQINKAVHSWLAVHGMTLTNKQRAPFYKDINRGLNEYLGIKTRTQLRRKDFDRADDFISNWAPSTAVIMEARNAQTELLEGEGDD